jgi:hypothetical protein
LVTLGDRHGGGWISFADYSASSRLYLDSPAHAAQWVVSAMSAPKPGTASSFFMRPPISINLADVPTAATLLGYAGQRNSPAPGLSNG